MAEPTAPSRLEHFPVPLFAAVMGIGGLSLAWRRAALVYDEIPAWIGDAVFWIALALFLLLVVAYTAKWLRHPAAAWAEARHPIRMAFVPTITIATLIIATAGQDLIPDVASALWWIGGVGHLLLTVVVMSAWFNRADIGLTQMTPAWFIPIVGNVITPLAAPAIGSMEFAWIAFGVGIVFWLALLPLLLFRLLLHADPLPPRLLPSLAIFVAPPAVSLLAWGTLNGQMDGPVGRLLYGATLAFVALVAAQFSALRRVPFAVSYWAYTFPAAAAAAAALAIAGARPQTGYDIVAGILLTLASLIITSVTLVTVRAAARGRICVPE
jgi:tellurite resistance protein